jgi:two-component system, OmpR family, sensor kinase
MATDRGTLPRLVTVQQRLLALPATVVADIASVLDQAATLVQEALGAEKVDVFLYDQARAALVAVGAGGTELTRREDRLGLDVLPLTEGGRFVAVFQTGVPYRTGRAERDRQELPRVRSALGVRSSMAAPLVVQGERVGVLAAASTQPRAFSARDLSTLELLAGLIAVVIERTRLQGARAEATRLEALLRARADFVATVSHDLHTPLTAIRAGLGLLDASARDKLAPDEREVLDTARHNVERLRFRINDLLAANQLDAGTLDLERVALDLRGVALQALQVIQPLLQEKGQVLEIDLPEPLPVTGDPARLEHVVINLLANAHRHTPSGTRITLSGRDTPQEVRLTVRDTGPGIPPGAHEAIFGRFHRLDPTARGSGLGLAVARAFVERHGGRLWAEQGPEGGAVFHVTLPHSTEAEGIT